MARGWWFVNSQEYARRQEYHVQCLKTAQNIVQINQNEARGKRHLPADSQPSYNTHRRPMALMLCKCIFCDMG